MVQFAGEGPNHLSYRFNPRGNAIGFLRLTFAVTVIVSHTWPLGGYGPDPGRADNNLGFLAVEGFFALSGYLITRSAARTRSVGRFLWHRCLRIFPGYWVSLVVVAVAAAAITGANSWGFVWKNLTLHIFQTGIGDTLANNPFPSMWNGPLYTLEYEFFCYLVVAALAALKLLRPAVLLSITGLCWVALQLAVNVRPDIDARLARATLAFFVGASLFSLAHRAPAGLTALAATTTLALATYWVGGFSVIGIPAFACAVVIASTWLPWRRVGTTRDFSYGIYVYAWPVEQVLVMAGTAALGAVVLLSLNLVIAVALAAASWYVVESRALTLKSVRWPGGSPATGSEATVVGVSGAGREGQ